MTVHVTIRTATHIRLLTVDSFCLFSKVRSFVSVRRRLDAHAHARSHSDQSPPRFALATPPLAAENRSDCESGSRCECRFGSMFQLFVYTSRKYWARWFEHVLKWSRTSSIRNWARWSRYVLVSGRCCIGVGRGCGFGWKPQAFEYAPE